ncbi:MAG: hypothetical protein H3Z54_08870 [archaeon]|nr:hypothetical protein [archaeon]
MTAIPTIIYTQQQIDLMKKQMGLIYDYPTVLLVDGDNYLWFNPEIGNGSIQMIIYVNTPHSGFITVKLKGINLNYNVVNTTFPYNRLSMQDEEMMIPVNPGAQRIDKVIVIEGYLKLLPEYYTEYGVITNMASGWLKFEVQFTDVQANQNYTTTFWTQLVA